MDTCRPKSKFITSYTVVFFSDFFIGKYNLTSFNGIFSLNYLSLQMLKAELPLRKPWLYKIHFEN